MAQFSVILPAAGRSTRFGASRNKLLEDLAGRSVIDRSIDAFTRRADVAEIIVVTDLELRFTDSRIRIQPGGPSRAHSVRAGLSALRPDTQWVAVHDAARPLVSQEVIDRTLHAAIEHGAAAPTVAVSATIKQADGPLPARVKHTPPRQQLWAMQTPQICRVSDLHDAFARCPIPLEQITDELQLLELAGLSTWLVEGEEKNLKVTTPLDLHTAAFLLNFAELSRK